MYNSSPYNFKIYSDIKEQIEKDHNQYYNIISERIKSKKDKNSTIIIFTLNGYKIC